MQDSARRIVLRIRRPLIVVTHVALFTLSYISSFLLRFDFSIPHSEQRRILLTLPILIVLRLSAFAAFRLFEGMWRYVSVGDLKSITKAVTVSSIGFTAIIFFFFGSGTPRSVLVLDSIITFLLVSGIRISIRMAREKRVSSAEDKRAIIVGAGDAAEILVREIGRNSKLPYRVVGLVDDDPAKRRIRIHGVEVLGTVLELEKICRQAQAAEILIAAPSASTEERQRIADICRRTGLPFKTLPVLPDLLTGRARIAQLHEVGPGDLLPRAAVHIDVNQLRVELSGKRVLVTGAGGSIGSELCRQVAALNPEVLVLFERAESPLYLVTRELQQRHPDMKIVPVIGDIIDAEKVKESMNAWLPDFVYHAAAYKHVPLMEEHPLEAIRNNVLGTEVVAEAAREAGVRRFILISTDKAVRPVGVMGRTKRVAECIMQSMQGGTTVFSAVRFGNVLGSDGSVLPLFAKQIASGGPVTITDINATRYMMLISEAAQLVIQASLVADGGEVFFLEMGEPVKIIDLANNLIRLSGLEPGKDVEVTVTGLRPGERLSEELVMDREELVASGHEGILMLRRSSFPLEAFHADLGQLRLHVATRDKVAAVELLASTASRH